MAILWTAFSGWFFSYWKIIAGVAVAVTIAASSWHIGGALVQGRWDRDALIKAQAEKIAIINRLAANAKLATEQEAARKLTQKGYEDEIAKNATAALAAGKLRYSEGFRAAFAVSGTSQSTDGSNAGTAATGLFPEPYAGNLRELMQKADTVTASCRASQKFIKDNGMD